MPEMRESDFSDVSGGGAFDGAAFSWVLRSFWFYGGSAQMGGVLGGYGGSGFYGPARANSSGRGELYGFWLRASFEFLHHTCGRNGCGPREADLRVSAACAVSVICRRTAGSGRRQRSALGG